MRRIIIIIITCIYVQWVAVVFLVYIPRRFGHAAAFSCNLREASALMRISSINSDTPILGFGGARRLRGCPLRAILVATRQLWHGRDLQSRELSRDLPEPHASIACASRDIVLLSLRLLRELFPGTPPLCTTPGGSVRAPPIIRLIVRVCNSR